MRSDWYGELEIPISRASALSHAVLFDGSFASVYAMPDELAKVTPAEVRAFAAKYLVAANRTIINRAPSAAAGAKTGGAR
jgi:predicted Zn-dependent peptidase